MYSSSLRASMTTVRTRSARRRSSSKPPPALSTPERSASRTAARSRSSKSKSSSCSASSRCSSSSRSSVITHVSFSAARSSRGHPLKGLQHLEFAHERLQSPRGLCCLPYQRQTRYAAARGGGGAHGREDPVIHCLPCCPVGEPTVPAARE